MMDTQQSKSELTILDERRDDALAQWAVKEIRRFRGAVRFCYDIADEELPHARVGTGAEVALRHIRRKASDALHIP
jgi:hypothetical protein